MYKFLILVVILLQTCNQMDKSSYTINYFNNGEPIIIDNHNRDEFISNVTELFFNTNEVIRQIVTSDLITEIKKENECIEVVFDNLITVKSKKLGNFKIKKILVPLSGKYIGNQESPSAIILIANDKGYITGPLGCKNGLQYVEGIKRALLPTNAKNNNEEK